MRSTSSNLSLTLTLRRAEVTAFWIVAIAMLAAAIALGAAVAGAQAPWRWAAAALLAAAPGLFWRPWFAYGVRGWNKGVRMIATTLRGYVLRVCYHAIFGAMRPTGSALELTLRRTELSRWIPHHRSHAGVDDAEADTDGPSFGGLLAASSRRGSRWMLGLLPMVMLLRVFGDQTVDGAPSASTYTLY